MASVATNGVSNGISSAPKKDSGLIGFRPVTIDHELLDVVELVKKAVKAKVTLPLGADVAVNEVTKQVLGPNNGARYDVIVYVYRKDERVFYEAAVTVDVNGNKKVDCVNELPHTYLVKELTVPPKQPSKNLAKVEAFAVKELEKKLSPFDHAGLVSVDSQLGPLVHDVAINITWFLKYNVSGPIVGYTSNWEVVVLEDTKTSKLGLISVTEKGAAPKQSGDREKGAFENVPVTSPLDPSLNKAVLFAVNSILADKKAKDGTLVKIVSADKQIVNGTNWRLFLTLSLAPREEDQTFKALVHEALDHTFKLTNYERKPIIGISPVTSDYYESYFANAAINFSIPYISKHEKESVTLLKVLSVGEETGVQSGPVWSLNLVVGHGGGLAPITGEALVATDEQAAPLPLKFLSWKHVTLNSEPPHTDNDGGFRKVDPRLPAVKKAAEFAAKHIGTLHEPHLKRQGQLARVISAEVQVVHGRNWRLEISVDFPPSEVAPRPFKVVVYENCVGTYELKSAVPVCA